MIAYTILVAISFILVGYLFGSVLFGVIISKTTKINLRKTGSQNVGGTNVSRTLGKHFGILVALLDGLKAYLAVIVCWIIFRYSVSTWFDNAQPLYPLIYIAGTFAVIGHCWPVQYLIKLFTSKFNFSEAKNKSGGKGVASTGGVLFAISPWLGLIAFGTFVIVVLTSKYVSLGSMICMFLPAFLIFVPYIDYLYLYDHSLLYNAAYIPDLISKIWLMLLMLCNSFIIMLRHTPNIQRLLKHEEKRFF